MVIQETSDNPLKYLWTLQEVQHLYIHPQNVPIPYSENINKSETLAKDTQGYVSTRVSYPAWIVVNSGELCASNIKFGSAGICNKVEWKCQHHNHHQ